jgi:Calcineurin-like phosphoesterase
MPPKKKLSAQLTQKLLSVKKRRKNQVNPLAQDWIYLQESELVFIDFMKNKKEPAVGNIEYGPALYLLHQLPKLVVDVLIYVMGMPPTQIKKTDWDTWLLNVEDGPGVVAGDGTIYLFKTYAQLDFGWTESLVYYLYYRHEKKKDAKFGTTPVTTHITGQPSLTIAIMGDWGTGNKYSDEGFAPPSQLVKAAINALNPAPDITLHLGDVYYAGLPNEEMNKMLKLFPRSKLANFTLNSNHEMYDGANGYFNMALGNTLFQKTQNNTSYFAVTFGNWVIIGLDTAFYDTSKLYMDGALYDTNQLNFIKGLKISKTQKIILMTHHTGLSADGKSFTPPTYDGTNIKKPLFTQVYNALGRYPDYWYYGHIHNGIVYNNLSKAGKYKCPSGASPQLRCVGHAAIPFGKGNALFTGNKNNPEITYFAQTKMANSKPPSKFLNNRVQNGFAVIKLSPTGITETFYEVSAVNGTKKVWGS